MTFNIRSYSIEEKTTEDIWLLNKKREFLNYNGCIIKNLITLANQNIFLICLVKIKSEYHLCKLDLNTKKLTPLPVQFNTEGFCYCENNKDLILIRNQKDKTLLSVVDIESGEIISEDIVPNIQDPNMICELKLLNPNIIDINSYTCTGPSYKCFQYINSGKITGTILLQHKNAEKPDEYDRQFEMYINQYNIAVFVGNDSIYVWLLNDLNLDENFDFRKPIHDASGDIIE